MKNLVFCVLALNLWSCDFNVERSSPISKEKHWTYTGETGPEHWAELEENSQCAGYFQSPINLVNYKVDTVLSPLELLYSEETILHDVVNNGHSLQYDFELGDVLVWENDTFHLNQFHFHEPAEHLIDGVRYPLEIHLVHQNKQKEFVVLSIMAKEGKNSQPFEFLESYLPLAVGEKKIINQPFDMRLNLPEDKNYFPYKGSLTTPPCQETVVWLVLQHPISVSLEQVIQLKYTMPINNYRQEQPLHGRTISASHF